MLNKYLVNGLVAFIAIAAVITGYNAFINDDNASGRLSSYLALDKSSLPTNTIDGLTAESDSGQAVSVEDSQSATATVEAGSQNGSASSATSTETTNTDTTVAPQAGSRVETIYTVQEGDTYGCIAEKYYGSFEHFVDVMAANPTSWVGFSEYGLHVGARLVLPAISAENLKPVSNLCS